MNDGKVSPDGKFFAGQMYIDGIIDLATAAVLNPDAFAFVGTMDNGGVLQSLVYSWDGQELSTLTDFGYHLITNGQSWNEDGTTYYVCDTIMNQVTAFDYDVNSGAVSNGRLVFTNEEGGNLDGASVDKFGYYWAAQNFGDGKVLKFDPETGKNVGSIQLRAGSTVSSLAFGGPDYKTMLVTSGQAQRQAGSADVDGPIVGTGGNWKAFNTIYASVGLDAYDVTMEFIDGECVYNLYGNGCNGIDGEICGGPCRVGDDFIEWTDNSGLAAADPNLHKPYFVKDF
jgi:sugar lactone lactonase YvrE